MPRGRPPRAAAQAAQQAQEQHHDSYAQDNSSVIDDSDDESTRPIKRGRGRPRGRPPGRKNTPRDEHVNINFDTSDLYETVRSGRCALQTVVDEWIDVYCKDRDLGILQLMQFLVRSSGCRGTITSEMRQTQDVPTMIRNLVEEFDEESADYPLISTGPQWKKFKQNFCDFIITLIRQCQYSIIYDQFLMEKLISFLTGLCDSQVRAFRHTATLASMKLMTALADIALALSVNLDQTTRQFEAERAKVQKTNPQRTERLDMFATKKQEVEENSEDIKSMLNYLFKSIFVHRYRDAFSEIRVICMYEIGQWMQRLPGIFLDDSYLKYVGWTLHDKIGEVRLKCLNSLLPLYMKESITKKMELFTNKFKERIVAMTLDKEPEVAVCAVKLITYIHKHNCEVLSDKDAEHVYELVYTTNRNVAQAAGEFLQDRLSSVEEEKRTKRGKKRSVNTQRIRDLIQFHIEFELHEHGSYLVDSLIESHPMMKDWECMTDLLLEEPGPEEEALDNKQETALIEVMVCCIRQAVTCEPPAGRGNQRRQLTGKELKVQAEDKKKISEHFVEILPALLAKYKTDAEKVKNLLCIPEFFDLGYFTGNNHIDRLLVLIVEMVDIHSDTDVLEKASKIFELLYDDNYSFSNNVQVMKSSLIDSIVEKYREWVLRYSQNQSGEDERIGVICQLKKLAIFYSGHDLTSWNLWTEIFERWIKPANRAQEEVLVLAVKYAIIVCQMGLLWDLHHVSKIRQANENSKAIQNKLFSFMSEIRALLSHDSMELHQEAYTLICDFLIVFSHHIARDSPAGPHLVCKPDANLIKQLENFIMTRVFTEPDEQNNENRSNIEVINQKRRFLAGFCKLIVYNIIPVKHAASVMKYYVKFYSDYGDIIKHTISKTREISKVNCAKTMAAALVSLFKDLNSDSAHSNGFTKQDEDFQTLKDLAKRFALSFGLDNLKNRDAFAELHKAGIQFAFETMENPVNPLGQPPNLAFLEVLMEFSNKLMKIDKKTVLTYLDRLVKNLLPGLHNDEWPPLVNYRSSLQHQELEVTVVRPQGKQYRGRKRNLDDDDEEADDGDEQTMDYSEMAE